MILASPIYFGQITAQAKTILDRFYSIFNNPDKKFDGIGHAYPDEDIYKPYVELLENQPFKMNTELEFIESLIAPGVKFIGDVDEHEEYLEKDYEIGQKF